jgi:hypothetical protein
MLLREGNMGQSSGTEDMAEDSALGETLSQLDGIANAPLTGSQREARAKPVLDAAGLTVRDVAQALGRLDLDWNRRKAAEYDVSPQTWLHAVKAVALPAADSVSDLLYRLHQAEAAVRMLRAGYSSAQGEEGLSWSRENPPAGTDAE